MTKLAPNALSAWEDVLLLGAIACYFVAMLLLWAHLFLRSDEPREHGRAWHEIVEIGSLALLFCGANLHALALFGQGALLWREKAGVAGVFGCALIIAYLGWRQRVGQTTLGAFVTPVALLASLYSLTAPPLHRYAHNPSGLEMQWLVVHVVTIVASYVALAFAFAASLIYLIQDHLLKRKQLRGLWQRLPSLQVADDVIYRATTFGVALMTLGLFLGVVWQLRHQAQYQVWSDPKVLFSLLTWAVFALYLGVRWRLGWRGRRTNLFVVYGFVLMVISFLGAPHLIGQ